MKHLTFPELKKKAGQRHDTIVSYLVTIQTAAKVARRKQLAYREGTVEEVQGEGNNCHFLIT